MPILADGTIRPVEMHAIGIGLQMAADAMEQYPEAAGTVAKLRAWARDYLVAGRLNITAHVLLDRPELPEFMNWEAGNSGGEPSR